MSIEISNVIHAMALVSVSTSGAPIFIGQGNVGFAPFGHGPDFSEQLGAGRFRLHMLAPLSIVFPNIPAGRGEGMIVAAPFALPVSGGFPLIPPVNQVFAIPSGLSDILVETTRSLSANVAGVTAFDEVRQDTSVAAGDFVDLLTTSIALPQGGSGILDIHATASAEAALAAREIQFRVMLDGAALGPGDANGATFTISQPPVTPAITAPRAAGPSVEAALIVKGSASILKRVASVAPGNHTVKLQWRVTGNGAAASILVSTGIEHGSLRVSQEASTESAADGDVPFQVLVLRFPQQSTTTG